MLSPGLGHWGADARPGDVIAFFCVERDTTTLHTHLLSPTSPPFPVRAGPLAPRRVGVDDVRSRADALLRAAPVHPQAQALDCVRRTPRGRRGEWWMRRDPRRRARREKGTTRDAQKKTTEWVAGVVR